jgi:hypothetical protein
LAPLGNQRARGERAPARILAFTRAAVRPLLFLALRDFERLRLTPASAGGRRGGPARRSIRLDRAASSSRFGNGTIRQRRRLTIELTVCVTWSAIVPFPTEEASMAHSPSVLRGGLAGLACFALALPATAGTIPADALPLPNRVANADVIVAGKVTAFEPKTVAAAAFAGAKNQAEFKIAVVTISDALLAPKGATTIRLGFVPPPPGVAISPPPFQPVLGQEGCFFLRKHGEADFLVPAGPLTFIDRKSATFDKDLALIKRCARLLEDPDTSLKAKDREDRFLAAAMLVVQYTTRKSPSAKAEPIDADQSKRILQALAGADWTPSTDVMQLSPLTVLHRLRLTDKDGWVPPAAKDPKAYAAYAQQWLKDHAESYRVTRFVEKSK